jgi:polysaccharide pyruvyl transferase WcaK-like protein
VVFGGGSLFTDVESSHACFLWFIHAWTSFMVGTPYFLAFQGIGPFRTKWGRRLAMWTVKHAAYVSLRDEESVVRLADFTMNTKCIRTFDPAILLIRKSFSVRSQNVITIIPRSNSKSKFIQAVQNVLAQQKSAHISILLMQPDDSREKAVADILLQLCKGRGFVTALSSFDELCENVAQSSLVLTERYHGALAALALRVPVKIITMAEGDKLSSLRMYAEGISPIGEMFSLARHGEDTLRHALHALS